MILFLSWLTLFLSFYRRRFKYRLFLALGVYDTVCNLVCRNLCVCVIMIQAVGFFCYIVHPSGQDLPHCGFLFLRLQIYIMFYCFLYVNIKFINYMPFLDAL